MEALFAYLPDVDGVLVYSLQQRDVSINGNNTNIDRDILQLEAIEKEAKLSFERL